MRRREVQELKRRTLLHCLGVALEGADKPGVVCLQKYLRSFPIPEHVGPIRVVAYTVIPPLPLETRPLLTCEPAVAAAHCQVLMMRDGCPAICLSA